MASILVIEDDASVRNMLRNALEHHGHTVRVAADGVKGLAALAEKGADILLTDLLMPEKEGFEVLLELKKQGSTIKTIAISGGGRNGAKTDYLQIAKHLGADKVLAKPFNTAQLIGAINELLGQPDVAKPKRKSREA